MAKTGFLQGDARQLCERVQQLAPLLTSQPNRHEICSHIAALPESAHVSGPIGKRQVDRHFSQANGCEIEDWNRAKALFAGARVGS